MEPLEIRFRKYFIEGAINECWLWQGTKIKTGYGEIRGNSRKKLRAHRVSYEIFKGPIPKNLIVCHNCDTPLCVNPHHLWLGSHADNMADKVAKGRQRGAPIKWICKRNHDKRITGYLQRQDGGLDCKECNKVRSKNWRKTQAAV